MSDRAGSRSRRGTVLAALAVFLVGVGMRTLPLHWTPLPYNVDGFHFAALAHRAGRTGHLSAAAQFIHPDEFVFTAYLTAVSQATGVAPLHVAQLLVAVIGTVPALVVFVLVWGICEQLGWRRSHTRLAAVLGGLLLSLDGVYLGRSAAVSSEMLGHALVVLTALAFYRALRTERPAWMALTLGFVVALPLTHNLSALVGALVLLAIFVRSLGVRTHVPTRRRAVFGSAIVALFWLDMLVYYQHTNLTAAGYVTALPGLLVAWMVFLVLFAGWLPSAGTVVQRFLPTFAVGGVGTLLVANHFLPIFPGSASTAPLQLALLVPLALVGLVAAWGLPKLARDAGPSVVVVGLLVGPLVLIGFAMTGSLTHEYEALAVRGQVFAHFALAALAAITAVDIGLRRKSSSVPTLGRRAVVPLVALCVVASAPFAFAGLHATPAQPTVTPTEFATGTFAANHVQGGWIGDGHMVIMTTNYYKDRTSAQYTPLYEWLKSGGGSTKGGTVAPDTPPPACPIVAQRSWTTLGAQVFPASPTKISADRYDHLTANRSVVYSASGRDPLVVTTPRRAGNCPVGPNEGPAAGLSSPRNESGS
ncbi:sodium/phosphate symporter [Haladaptatus sp. AB618]|uniref:sodium/phosphate symporter n=1 Tax=Haladaptatus sp. AB618 TaxID=2934173 RepID=UPI00209C0B8D|nr:sodium/phosphate symporter [Haladaptatus sp. AB618]MCO8255395.1 sodium/phosphate symporter [Haladaptatus sp. AB618]